MNIENLFENVETTKEKDACRCVVRVTTTAWHDRNGAYLKKTFRYLKRQCANWNALAEECDAIGASEALDRVVNLYSVEDGIYEVILINVSSDWETGYVDDWDLQLVPFRPETIKK